MCNIKKNKGTRMTKDEALKLALSTLDEVRQETFRLSRDGQKLYAEDKVWSTIISIKEVLAQPEQVPLAWEQFHEHMARPFYKAPPQPEQELVAWGVFESNLHDMFFTEAEAVEMAQLKGNHAEVKPLYTAPQRKPQYDKTKMNCFVQDLYDKKIQEGKHGQYEAMFHVVHRAIEAAHGIKEMNNE